MKKLIPFGLLAICAWIVLESFHTGPFAKRDGTEPGYTGSPGDSLKNCTACHGGTAVDVEGWITSTVPSTGFVPGTRYTITATNTEPGATRFGFSVSPQAPNGDLLGTIIITDTVTTKTVGNDKYVTYRADGVQGVDSKSWSFDWIAPSAAINEVVFYGAFNSNHEGHKEGDKTYLSRLRLRREGTLSIESVHATAFNIFPNPVMNEFSLRSVSGSSAKSVTLYNPNGQRVFTTTATTSGIDISHLSKGVYHVLVCDSDGHETVTKLLKQ